MKKISHLKTALTYANALYEGAREVQGLEIAYQNALALRNLSPQDFAEIAKLNNPLIKIADKEKLLTLAAQKLDLSTPVLNMFKLMAENHKLDILLPAVEQFIILYQNKHELAEVQVTTVQALSAEQEKLLREKLAKIFNKQIVLHYFIDPQIIGGLVLQYADNLIDNSVKHKLDSLEKLMKGNK